MDIYNKFKQGISTRTYQRIDSDYSINLFLGYNEEGQMSMVLTEFGRVENVRSSKEINVQMKRREDGKIALSFDLINDSYSSLFMVFCKDLIVTCEKGGKELAISNALIRWKYWKEMFGKKKTKILKKNDIKGLIGELIQLKEYFFPKYGVKRSIESWMGPLLGHKDFEIEDTWFEVKAINENSLQVIINSIEQLESNVEGHLMVVKLDEMTPESNMSINLPQYILSVTDEIDEPEILDMFVRKLEGMGYLGEEEYENYNYSYKGTAIYTVNESFPRIRRNEVNDAIGNVQYSIILGGIINYREVE